MNDQNTLPSNIDIINVLKNSNLTPSQKVSVITEINNKNQPSKNLSHVPCKFFRQGACQAGNSCPFSHATDLSQDTQPCKYFQKGNCKFGIKCALAHVMPDGKKVNTKILQTSFANHSLSPKNQHQYPSAAKRDSKTNININNSGSTSNSNDSSPSDIINTVEPININDYYNSTTSSSPTQTNSQQNPFLMNAQFQQPLNYSNYNSYYGNAGGNSMSNNNYNYNSYNYNASSSVSSTNNNNGNQMFSFTPNTTQTSSTAPPTQNGMATSPFNNSIWSNGSNANANNNQQFIRSLSFPNNHFSSTNNMPPVTNMNRVPSMSNSSFNQSFTSPSQLIFSPPISSTNNQNYSAIVDSAILDSETEGTEEEEDGHLKQDIDYVPSSLNDLLTPQELKRRNSRSSFGSQQFGGFTMSAVKDVYNLVEEDAPFIMD